MLLTHNLTKILSVTKQAIIKLFIVITVTLFLSACGGENSVSLEERMQRALTWQSNGNLQAAAIELKNALITYPDSQDVRFLLGRVYLELGMGFAAENEIKKAAKLGIDENITLLPLAESWLLQRKYDRIIEEISYDADSVTPVSLGQRYFLGAAHLGKGEINKAESYFDEILQSTPGNMRALVGKARVSFIKKDIENTNKYIELAEAILPNDKELLQLRASRSWLAKDFEAVEGYYSKLVEHYPDFHINEIYLAWVKLINGKPDETENILLKYRDAAPENWLINYVSALHAVMGKNYLEAKTYAETALLSVPGDLRTKFIAATATFALGDIEQSYSYIKQYLEAVPEDLRAKELLARLQMSMNKNEEAYATLKDISGQAVKKEKFLNVLASYELQKGDIELARIHLEQSLQENPEQMRSRQKLAFLKISEGEIEDGLREMEKALATIPDDYNRKMQLARAFIVARKYAEGIEICQKLQKMDSEDVNGYLCEATALYQKGDSEQALPIFMKVLTKNPGDPEASRIMTAIYMKNNMLDKAIDVQVQYLKVHPRDARATYSMYMLKKRAGNDAEAIEYLKKSVELNPKVRLSVLHLARHYLTSNEADKALKVSDDIIKRYPNTDGLLEVRGKAQMALKKFDDAVVSFENLVEIYPKNSVALSLLASAYNATRNYAKLEAVSAKILSMAPEDAKSRIILAKIEASRGNWHKADDILSDIKGDFKEDVEYFSLRGRVKLINKEYDQAISFFEKTFQLETNTENMLQLAIAHRLSGKFDTAVNMMEDWSQKHPDDMITKVSLGDIYLKNKDYEKANEKYVLILEKRPRLSGVLNNLAWSLHKLNKTDEALLTIRKAREINPNAAALLDTEAEILLDNGEVNEAIRQYRKAVDNAPNALNFKYHLVLALIKAGETGEAIEILKDLKSDGRSFDEQEDAFALLEKLTTE